MHRSIWLSLGLLGLLACKKHPKESVVIPAGSVESAAATTALDTPPTATAPAIVPNIPDDVVGPGPRFALAPMGAPDDIEPPSRAVIPGMTVAQARAHGATGDLPFLDVTPEITALVEDQGSGLVRQLDVSYEKTAFAALEAKWGKPNLGESWVGANWMATPGGCQGSKGSECGMSFQRAPGGLLMKTPAPPTVLASLRPSMTMNEVKARIGFSFENIGGSDVGYPLAITIGYDEKKLEQIVLSASGGTDDAWLPLLTARWGKPKALPSGGGEKDVWVNAAEGWLVVWEEFPGWTITYRHMTPLADVLVPSAPNGIVARAHAMLGRDLGTIKRLPGANEYGDVYLEPCEYSLREVELSPDFDDKGLARSVSVIFDISDDQRAAAETKILAAWGATKKPKPDDSEGDLFALGVAGVDDLEMTHEAAHDTFVLQKKRK